MKQEIKNYVTIALLVVFSTMTTIVKANEEKKHPSVSNLKYLGMVDNKPTFQLDVNSDREDQFTILIKDGSNVFYTEKIRAKTFKKVFQLDLDDLGDVTDLRVEIRKKDPNTNEVFAISMKTRLIMESSISKL